MWLTLIGGIILLIIGWILVEKNHGFWGSVSLFVGAVLALNFILGFFLQ